MKFKENDVVRVMTDYQKNVRKGEVGTIIMAFDKPREAYEVELLDESGNPKVQCTFGPDDLELVMF